MIYNIDTLQAKHKDFLSLSAFIVVSASLRARQNTLTRGFRVTVALRYSRGYRSVQQTPNKLESIN